jgi:ATP-dependent exoDNAse (exonuclease V) alpha subunit
MSARGTPFGGIQVIFVGDFFQLPPVTKGDKMVAFAFESQAWLAAEPKICYLTEQHRQEDAEFLDILTAMRQGTLTKKHVARIRERVQKPPEKITELYTHNADVDMVNARELEKLLGESHVFHMQTQGIPFLVDTLKRNCLSPEVLEVKIGAPVMFTRNDIQKDGSTGEYVNGTLGEVIGFNSFTYPIVRTKDGREISIDNRQEWTIEEHGYVKASISQIPLRLAWAITVHKCQGMSLDSAVLDLRRAFEKALLMHPTVIAKDGLFRKLSGMEV